jgi:hypothetical protein
MTKALSGMVGSENLTAFNVMNLSINAASISIQLSIGLFSSLFVHDFRTRSLNPPPPWQPSSRQSSFAQPAFSPGFWSISAPRPLPLLLPLLPLV